VKASRSTQQSRSEQLPARSPILPQDGTQVKGRVLVAAPEPSQAKTLRDLLRALSFSVRTACKAEEAWEIIDKRKIDVLLLDLDLSGRSGFDLMDEAFKLQPEMQCIVLIGLAERERGLAAMRLGACGFLISPVSFDELEIVVGRALENIARLQESRRLKMELDRTKGLLEQEIRKRRRAEGALRRSLTEKKNFPETEGSGKSPYRVLSAADAQLEELIAEITSELLESQDFLDGVIAAMPDALLDFGPEGTLRFSNRALSTMLGYSQMELTFRPAHALFFSRRPGRSHQASPFAGTPLAQVTEATRITNVQGELLHKDGRRVPVLVSGSARRDRAGRFSGIVCVAKDITDRLLIEKEAEIHRQQLIRADKMVSLGTLVSGVMHEINNPNNFIMLTMPSINKAWQGLLPILDRRMQEHGDFDVGAVPFSELRELLPVALNDVMEGARRIERLVGEFKEFARPVNNTRATEVEVNRIVDAAVTLVSQFVASRTNHFHVDLDQAIPSIIGNPQQIEQVIINLLCNACEALSSRKQAVVIRTRFLAENQQVVIAVIDEGCGITEEQIGRLTDPFFTTKQDSGGMGLGLSVCARLIKMHGGALHFSSSPGTGTTAEVRLPAAIES